MNVAASDMRSPRAPASHSIPPRGSRAPRVVAVIPVHDEAATIASVVEDALVHCDRVVVVDDGSADDSARIAANAGAFVVRQERRRGKGAAIRRGIETVLDLPGLDTEALGAIVLLDGDGQHDPADIPRFIAALARGARIAVGDRSTHFARMSRVRRWTNRAMTRVLASRFLAGAARAADSQCGFRALDATTCRALSFRSDHFEVESEMLIEAARLELRCENVPIRVRPRRGRSRIRVLPDTLRFLALVVVAASERRDG